MVESNQSALQVFENGQWEYVFCRGMPRNCIVTTKDREKALSGRHIDFFSEKFANNVFRIQKTEKSVK